MRQHVKKADAGQKEHTAAPRRGAVNVGEERYRDAECDEWKGKPNPSSLPFRYYQLV